MRSLLNSQDCRIETESLFLMNSQWLPTANRKKMFKRKTKWTFDHVVKDLGYIQLKKKKKES